MDALSAALALVLAAALSLGGPPRFLPPWTAAFLLSAALFARVWRRERAAGRDPVAAAPDAVLFWGSLTLYLASFRWHGGDDIPNSLLPYQIWRHGTLSFDALGAWNTAPAQVDLVHKVGGHWLSAYPIAPGVLAAPLYALPALFVPEPSDAFLHSLAKTAGALITAASAVAVRRAAARRCSERWAFDVAVLYALGSYAYSVSSQALYSHAPAALGVALGLWGLFSEGAPAAAAAGFGLALAWASREDSLVFAGAGAAYLLFHAPRRLPAFLLGAAVPAGLNLAYWRWSTGAFHPPYYELQRDMFVLPDWEAAAAMVLSPTRGMLFFFPAAVFGGWGAWKALRRPGGAWAFYFLGGCLATWLAFSMRTSWTAGNTYGERYFAVVCLVFALFCAELEDQVRGSARARAAWSAVLAYSVMLHAVGAHFQWPGYRMTLGQQLSTTWSPAWYPLVFLFRDGGPIDATPLPWRLLYGAALAAVPAVLAWRWSRRRMVTLASPE